MGEDVLKAWGKKRKRERRKKTTSGGKKRCRNPGLNQGPLDLQSNALPTELGLGEAVLMKGGKGENGKNGEKRRGEEGRRGGGTDGRMGGED